MTTIYKQPIYMIVQGASCNDIVSSVHEEFPKLDELGIREMFVIREMGDIKKKLGIDDANLINPTIITSFDVPAIESAFILYNSVSDNVEVVPVPYLSDKTSIKNENMLGRFKELFEGGNYKKYWHGQELAANLTSNSIGVNSLRTRVPKISWKFTEKKVVFKSPNGRNVNIDMNSTGLRSFQFDSFKKKVLFPMIMENIQNGKNGYLKPIIMVCNYQTVLKMINEVKNRGFKEGVDTIERGSIWKIDMTFEYGTESGSAVSRFSFVDRSKTFPSEASIKASSVTFNKNKKEYMIKLKGKSIPMGLANKPVSKKIAVSLECKFCKRESDLKESLKQIYNEMSEENKAKVKPQSANQNNQNTKGNLGTSNITSLGSAVKALTKMPVF
jgi:hypothetical protein